MPRLMTLVCLFGFLCSTSSDGSAQSPPVKWELVTGTPGWEPRDSQGEVVFQNQMWIFGGWFNSYAAPPRDVWSSADGKTWKKVSENAPWKHSDLPMTAVFHDRMWYMGGWFNGRLPGHSASNEVWWTTDGLKWDQSPNAGWTPRISSAIAVFKGKLWILGGQENYYFGDEKTLKNDVWSTADGKTWTQVVANAPWAPRAYHQAAVLGDKLYVFGGGNYVPKYFTYNDVWSTTDGEHWTQETAAAPWAGRIWFSTEVYRDQMWVLGGWSNDPSRPNQNWGDAWYSANGKNWTELKTEGGWKERHELSAFVLHDKLWIAGGHAKPLSSEVWSLELPKDWKP